MRIIFLISLVLALFMVGCMQSQQPSILITPSSKDYFCFQTGSVNDTCILKEKYVFYDDVRFDKFCVSSGNCTLFRDGVLSEEIDFGSGVYYEVLT
jgi:hypothetical protein